MFGFTEINESPTSVFEKLIEMNDTKMDYLYGPYLIHNNHFEMYDFVWETRPVLKMFTDINALIALLKQDKSIGDFKKAIGDYLVKNHKCGDSIPEAKIALSEYERILDALRKMQYTDKLLEGALTSYAPIVQYAGTIKAPMMTDDECIKSLDITNEDLSSISIINNCLSHSLLSIVESSEWMTPFTDNDLLSLYIYQNTHDDYRYATNYYIAAYLMVKDDDNIVPKLKEVANADNNITKQKFDTEKMISILESEDIASVDKSISDFNTDKNIEDIMQLAHVEERDVASVEKNYDLYNLTDYIYTSRRYMHNKYTNSLFLSSHKEFNDCSYLKDDLLVAEVDDQYLCSPVIDLADDYKTKLIRLDKNNNISIIPLI